MYLSTHIPALLRSPRAVIAAGFVVATAVGWLSFEITRRRPTEAELERKRRDLLSTTGRLVDGSITETRWLTEGSSPMPQLLMYRYRIAGVTYECGQDVHTLEEHVRHVRIDLPVQVRFNPRNPGDSIVVSESWTGLRMSSLPENLIHELPPQFEPGEPDEDA